MLFGKSNVHKMQYSIFPLKTWKLKTQALPFFFSFANLIQGDFKPRSIYLGTYKMLPTTKNAQTVHNEKDHTIKQNNKINKINLNLKANIRTPSSHTAKEAQQHYKLLQAN